MRTEERWGQVSSQDCTYIHETKQKTNCCFSSSSCLLFRKKKLRKECSTSLWCWPSVLLLLLLFMDSCFVHFLCGSSNFLRVETRNTSHNQKRCKDDQDDQTNIKKDETTLKQRNVYTIRTLPHVDWGSGGGRAHMQTSRVDEEWVGGWVVKGINIALECARVCSSIRRKESQKREWKKRKEKSSTAAAAAATTFCC